MPAATAEKRPKKKKPYSRAGLEGSCHLRPNTAFVPCCRSGSRRRWRRCVSSLGGQCTCRQGSPPEHDSARPYWSRQALKGPRQLLGEHAVETRARASSICYGL